MILKQMNRIAEIISNWKLIFWKFIYRIIKNVNNNVSFYTSIIQ